MFRGACCLNNTEFSSMFVSNRDLNETGGFFCCESKINTFEHVTKKT
jgi:hypothetical protein